MERKITVGSGEIIRTLKNSFIQSFTKQKMNTLCIFTQKMEKNAVKNILD